MQSSEFVPPTRIDDQPELGDIKINHTVVASIVRLAALHVKGVAAVGGGLADGISELFQNAKPTPGASGVAESGDDAYSIELRIAIIYGTEIGRTAYDVQFAVRKQVMAMTGKDVAKVDVIIEGVRLPSDQTGNDPSQGYRARASGDGLIPTTQSGVAPPCKAWGCEPPESLQKVLVFLIEATITTLAFVLLIWVLLALLVIVIVVQAPQSLVLSNGESGRLEISRQALHRVIESCCEQVRGIASARASVSRKGKLLHTELRLKIRPDAKLDAIQGYLTQEIKDIYGQNLGLKDIGPIEIKVIGIEPLDQKF